MGFFMYKSLVLFVVFSCLSGCIAISDNSSDFDEVEYRKKKTTVHQTIYEQDNVPHKKSGYHKEIVHQEIKSGTTIINQTIYNDPKSNGVIVQQTIDDKNPKRNGSVYVCKLTAFSDTFIGENVNRGFAKLSAKKQCLAQYHEMFCSEKEIKCQEYK